MLTGLGHRAVGSSHHQDGTVHLSGARDHVLHIVSVPRAVDVSVVTLFGLVLNVSGVNRNTTSLFFRSCVDLIIGESRAAELLGEDGRQSGRQGGLAVVNVTNRAHVHVGLATYILLFFCHGEQLPDLVDAADEHQPIEKWCP